MTVIAVVVATPIGILAGTYLTEYSRGHWLGEVAKFINDILLSAPSIIIGLFVYTVLVVPFGHFSAWAGAASLGLIALPVINRTTQDMLALVPNALREATAALGAPRWKSMLSVIYRAAMQRHPDRRAARHRPCHRRDRAAAVHGAQQPVLLDRPRRPDGEPCRS